MRASERSWKSDGQDLRAHNRKAPSDCEICRSQCGVAAHWRWHDYCRAELNPLALVQFIESLPTRDTASSIAIVGYVVAVTGMDYGAAKQAWVDEQGTK